jgi:Tfp pilus assembly protein FimT
MDTLKLRTSAQKVVSALRLARSKALREQQIYWVGLDPKQGVVEVVSEDRRFRRQIAMPEGIGLTGARSKQASSEAELVYHFFLPPVSARASQLL